MYMYENSINFKHPFFSNQFISLKQFQIKFPKEWRLVVIWGGNRDGRV